VWILAASWWTYSIAAAFMAIAIITIVRPRLSFWLTATVMAVLAVWDFIQVSVTHATVRAVVAADPFISVATPSTHAAGVPGLIGIAGQATLVSPYAVALGVGDVTLPGILIVIAGRAGRQVGTSRLYVAAISGYAIGLAACLAVPASVSTALPALVFLIPGVIVAVALTARRAGAWSALASKDLSRPVLNVDALPTPNHRQLSGGGIGVAGVPQQIPAQETVMCDHPTCNWRQGLRRASPVGLT
jgi:presenilin-like A22 family membrane protease